MQKVNFLPATLQMLRRIARTRNLGLIDLSLYAEKIRLSRDLSRHRIRQGNRFFLPCPQPIVATRRQVSRPIIERRAAS
jgi:hypothetical protein